MDDTQIIDLYFLRNESAIAETSKKYGAYLNQIAYNILSCPEDSEEVVEDTYFAAWNAIPPEIPRVLKHFLSRITRNLAFNKLDYRSAKCRDTHMILLLSELESCVPDEKSDPDSILEAKHLGRVLNLFLSRQERLDCAVFLSRYYHCRNIQQIADAYGLTQRQVKYRISVLRQKLRKELEKEGIEV